MCLFWVLPRNRLDLARTCTEIRNVRNSSVIYCRNWNNLTKDSEKKVANCELVLNALKRFVGTSSSVFIFCFSKSSCDNGWSCGAECVLFRVVCLMHLKVHHHLRVYAMFTSSSRRFPSTPNGLTADDGGVCVCQKWQKLLPHNGKWSVMKMLLMLMWMAIRWYDFVHLLTPDKTPRTYGFAASEWVERVWSTSGTGKPPSGIVGARMCFWRDKEIEQCVSSKFTARNIGPNLCRLCAIGGAAASSWACIYSNSVHSAHGS